MDVITESKYQSRSCSHTRLKDSTHRLR